MKSMGGMLTPRTPRHRQRSISAAGDQWGIQETTHLTGTFGFGAPAEKQEVDPEHGIRSHACIDVPPEMETDPVLRLIELPGQLHPGGSQPWDGPTNPLHDHGIEETVADILTRVLSKDSIVIVAVIPRLRDLRKFATNQVFEKARSCFTSSGCAPCSALCFIIALAFVATFIAPASQARDDTATATAVHLPAPVSEPTVSIASSSPPSPPPLQPDGVIPPSFDITPSTAVPPTPFSAEPKWTPEPTAVPDPDPDSVPEPVPEPAPESLSEPEPDVDLFWQHNATLQDGSLSDGFDDEFPPLPPIPALPATETTVAQPNQEEHTNDADDIAESKPPPVCIDQPGAITGPDGAQYDCSEFNHLCWDDDPESRHIMENCPFTCGHCRSDLHQAGIPEGTGQAEDAVINNQTDALAQTTSDATVSTEVTLPNNFVDNNISSATGHDLHFLEAMQTEHVGAVSNPCDSCGHLETCYDNLCWPLQFKVTGRLQDRGYNAGYLGLFTAMADQTCDGVPVYQRLDAWINWETWHNGDGQMHPGFLYRKPNGPSGSYWTIGPGNMGDDDLASVDCERGISAFDSLSDTVPDCESGAICVQGWRECRGNCMPYPREDSRWQLNPWLKVTAYTPENDG